MRIPHRLRTETTSRDGPGYGTTGDRTPRHPPTVPGRGSRGLRRAPARRRPARFRAREESAGDPRLSYTLKQLTRSEEGGTSLWLSRRRSRSRRQPTTSTTVATCFRRFNGSSFGDRNRSSGSSTASCGDTHWVLPVLASRSRNRKELQLLPVHHQLRSTEAPQHRPRGSRRRARPEGGARRAATPHGAECRAPWVRQVEAPTPLVEQPRAFPERWLFLRSTCPTDGGRRRVLVQVPPSPR